MTTSAPPVGPVPVLTFLSNFLIGGTERHVVNLVRHHDRGRYDIHLACFRVAGPLLPEVDASVVALSEYPITTLKSLRTLGQQWRLLRYMRKHHIRIVHAFGFYANVFAIPVARFAGADLVLASIRDTGDHLSRLQKFLQKWTCRAADHVLVNAEAVRTVLVRQGYAASRITVIRNGIDVSRFAERRGGTEIRSALGFPRLASVVAVFARLNRLKGIEYFLEAAAILRAQFEDARFLVVGDSISEAYRADLEARARDLGLGERVVFAGFRSDVPELLREVSVSVLPSLAEGLSNVVLEAMAAGVPVVATSVGGTPEMLDDGVQGLLVPPRDAPALARAIGALLSDPTRRQAMGQAGRARAMARFSLEAAVRETELLYERLLLPGAPPAPAVP
ncbi:MAG: glycosyltransferase, partial [Vicinamibacteria bacterium]|nr:glycosyltransferase [Vicinamibacteria bacterium]